MKSSLSCLLAVFLIGIVVGYTEEELSAVTQTVSVILDNNPLVQGVPNNNACRDNVKNFFLGSLPVVLPAIDDNNLAAALTTVAVIEGDLVTLDGEVIINVVQGNEQLTPEACRPLCEMAKASCGCDAVVWENLVILTGNNAETATSLINTFVESCMASLPAMSFESTLAERDSCAAEFSTDAFVCE